jgi:Uma2 family endonuclease
METMTAATTPGPAGRGLLLPRSRPLTRRDLDETPDDGHRYELVDGVLIVTPAPSYGHQDAVGHLYLLLTAACPADLKILLARFDVALADDTVMQPDLLVARRSDFTRRDLPVAPVLAVEVLSPSTRRIDLTLKRARLEEAGCASYWVVDPDEPAVTAWELRGGEYVEAARARGEERFAATRPFDVAFAPTDLRD